MLLQFAHNQVEQGLPGTLKFQVAATAAMEDLFRHWVATTAATDHG